MIEHRASKLIKLDIMVAGDVIDALSIIIHKDKAYKSGSELCKKLKKLIPRHQFEVPIQAVIGNKIIENTFIIISE